MSVEIKCPKFWTYRKETGIGAIVDHKMPLSCLDDHEYTHIHGELQIVIDGRIVPHLGHYTDEDVCIGNWTVYLSKLFEKFETGIQTHIIYGDDQGQPDYRFEKENNDIYISIVESILGGEDDPNWQKIKFDYIEFKEAFNKFKKGLLLDIAINAPEMVSYWNKVFVIKK